jgi:hypothetical protein
MKTFRQLTGTRKIYHADVSDSHPLAIKPSWTLEHFPGDEPSPHHLCGIETSVDGLSARLVAHNLTGRVEVVVTASVEHRGTVCDRFAVEILAPPAETPTLQFSQHRDRGHL